MTICWLKLLNLLQLSLLHKYSKEFLLEMNVFNFTLTFFAEYENFDVTFTLNKHLFLLLKWFSCSFFDHFMIYFPEKSINVLLISLSFEVFINLDSPKTLVNFTFCYWKVSVTAQFFPICSLKRKFLMFNMMRTILRGTNYCYFHRNIRVFIWSYDFCYSW
jgi:hypothetical protein